MTNSLASVAAASAAISLVHSVRRAGRLRGLSRRVCICGTDDWGWDLQRGKAATKSFQHRGHREELAEITEKEIQVVFLLCVLCQLFSVPFVFGSSRPARTSTNLLGTTTCWKLVLQGVVSPKSARASCMGMPLPPQSSNQASERATACRVDCRGARFRKLAASAPALQTRRWGTQTIHYREIPWQIKPEPVG